MTREGERVREGKYCIKRGACVVRCGAFIAYRIGFEGEREGGTREGALERGTREGARGNVVKRNGVKGGAYVVRCGALIASRIGPEGEREQVSSVGGRLQWGEYVRRCWGFP